MPIYADKVGRDELLRLLEYNVCAECGAFLKLSLNHERHCDMLVCERFPEHEGIVREASPYEEKGDESLTILTRRKKMVEEHGEKKTRALAKLEGVTSLTKADANEILTTIYPNAPKTEIQRAMLLCASYSLNPLMGHVFLIPFKGEKGLTYATVMGIKANRLLASRRGNYSYLDDTPRLMSEEEQVKIYGEIQKGFICAITKLKDPATRAEVAGYGKWKRGTTVHGTDKGNSAENMAFIRSERQALDRLRPGEMPMNVEVIDERFMGETPAPEDKKSPDEVKGKDEPDVFDVEAGGVEEEGEEEGKEEPRGDPSKYGVADLWAIAKENGWGPMDIGRYANSDERGQKGGWAIRDTKDLEKLTAEQIGELIDVITKNPKTK